MEVDKIVDNIIEGMQNIIPWIIDSGVKIKNIEQIDLKLFNSVSLPIFNYLSKKEMKAYLLKVEGNFHRTQRKNFKLFQILFF